MKSEKLSKKFKFLPDIATADLAFEASGSTYSELFENAGLALESSMVALESLEPKVTRKINLEKDSLEGLLFAFLEELIFLKDAEQMLFNRIKCNVRKVNSEQWPPARRASGSERGWELRCKLSGEKINPEKHKLGVDVKAATKHLFKLERFHDKTYRCRVVLDI